MICFSPGVLSAFFFPSFLFVLFWGNGLVVVTGLTVDTLSTYLHKSPDWLCTTLYVVLY